MNSIGHTVDKVEVMPATEPPDYDVGMRALVLPPTSLLGSGGGRRTGVAAQMMISVPRLPNSLEMPAVQGWCDVSLFPTHVHAVGGISEVG